MDVTTPLAAFKAYDVRGQVPAELNERMMFAIGQEVVPMVQAHRVVVGQDARLESGHLMAALVAGLQAAGADVVSLGLCGTEEVYAATAQFGRDLGMMVTASHNPKGYNGLKMILADGVAFSGQHLKDLEARVRAALPQVPAPLPPMAALPMLEGAREAYLERVLAMVDAASLPPLKLVVNCMNGSAGPALHALADRLPQMTWVWMQDAPDGHFPHGLPNPLLPEQRHRTAEAVRAQSADLGVAFDGDFDRCFLFTQHGEFVAPYYTLGMLAQAMLAEQPGAAVVHDPRLYWDTLATIAAGGGQPIVSRGGHLFFKQKLRETGAIFGAETSGHYFFKDFFCCDSGVIPLLVVMELMGKTGQSLAELVQARVDSAPAMDETNFRLHVSAQVVLDALKGASEGAVMEEVDGLGFDFGDWRCNVRTSNTEPLLRLNVEAKDAATLKAKHAELVALIEEAGAVRADH